MTFAGPKRFQPVPVTLAELPPLDAVVISHDHYEPENALRANALLAGARFLPVHWGTFNLAMHAWDDPAETLVSLAPSMRTVCGVVSA